MLEQLSKQFPRDDFALLGLVLLLPLVGALANGLFGKRLGKDGVRAMALASVGGSFVLSVVAFLLVRATPAEGDEPVRLVWHAWEWFRLTSARRDLVVELAFSVDALGAVMTLVVTGIGWLIHLYSTEYMKDDAGYHRYFSYLNLFIFAMLLLVLGDNLPVMFIGWEGVGLASYLLIGFWFEDDQKASAGKKAFIVNRIGDAGLILAMVLLVRHAHTLRWSELEKAVGSLATQIDIWPFFDIKRAFLPDLVIQWLTPAETFRVSVATLVALALFLGCAGKSAQIPLYVWLPDAMAGPTPVSALIHAATMVTAGVYLVARTSFLFVASPFAMAVVAVVGALTALFAATIAFAQNDLKKVLAYSTVSQLGFMFVGVGSGAFAAGMFHVVTHAFFKGCLFLCAGAVIHALHHGLHDETERQDMRNMGGLRALMPVTHWTFLASCLAIAGCPFLSGFWSKDEIMLRAFTQSVPATSRSMWAPPAWLGDAVYVACALAALGTAFYMFRAYFMTFWGTFRGWKLASQGKASRGKKPKRGTHHPAPHDPGWAMKAPLVVLAAGACVVGFLYAEPLHLEPFARFLAPVFRAASTRVATAPGAAGLAWPLLGAGAVIFLVGAGAAYWVYAREAGAPAKRFVERLPRLHRLVERKWLVDEAYGATVVGLVDALGDTAAQLDKYVVDGLLARVTSALTVFGGFLLRKLQTGRVQVYTTSMVAGVAAVGWFFLTPHAEAEVDTRLLRASGEVRFSAERGHGYRYRWSTEGGAAPVGSADFGADTGYQITLGKCERRTVKLEVENLFGRVAEARFSECRESVAGCCSVKSAASATPASSAAPATRGEAAPPGGEGRGARAGAPKEGSGS
jgi:NADH-quinone oxidoreductase subunit L